MNDNVTPGLVTSSEWVDSGIWFYITVIHYGDPITVAHFVPFPRK